MKQVKLLFLDIDGVLNCKATAYSPIGVRDIDNDKLLLLKRIIEATEAKILLISSWKEGWYSNPNKKSEQTEIFGTITSQRLPRNPLCHSRR